MILGTLQYPSRYCGLGERVQKALKFLAERELEAFLPGRYFIDGDLIVTEVTETNTVAHDSRLFEAHRNFVDIHLTLSGEEWYGYVPINNLTPVGEYDAEKDLAWYQGEGVYFQVPKGQFVLFFPEDAHKSCVAFTDPASIKKLIVKIKI